MKRFSVSQALDADCVVASDSFAGEVYHVQRNSSGGAVLTPIARYFGWKPEFVEGFNPHWHVDCFVRVHELAPDAMSTGQALVAALMREGLCSEPIWLSVHKSEELEGQAYGAVFEDD